MRSTRPLQSLEKSISWKQESPSSSGGASGRKIPKFLQCPTSSEAQELVLQTEEDHRKVSLGAFLLISCGFGNASITRESNSYVDCQIKRTLLNCSDFASQQYRPDFNDYVNLCCQFIWLKPSSPPALLNQSRRVRNFITRRPNNQQGNPVQVAYIGFRFIKSLFPFRSLFLFCLAQMTTNYGRKEQDGINKTQSVKGQLNAATTSRHPSGLSFV